MRSGFCLLERWVKANGGACGGGDVVGFREVAGELDLLSMPLKALREALRSWEVVDAAWVEGLYERKEAAGADAHMVAYKVGRRYDLGEGVDPSSIALHGRGSEQRMAIADSGNTCVYILNVESGERVATVVGSEGDGPGQFRFPTGVAFSSTGELYVSDPGFELIFVFDREGRYVRAFGGYGQGEGQFSSPSGLCFTADGNLVVADCDNHQVQIVREDGTFVRAFGSFGGEDGQFDSLFDVSVGPDGSIAVLDECDRVQIFDGEGRFVRSFGSQGDGPGQFKNACGVAHGAGGEIIVTDCVRKDVQMFSREGGLVQIIGAEGDSKVAWHEKPCGVAVDAEGVVAVVDALPGESLGFFFHGDYDAKIPRVVLLSPSW